MKTRKLDIGWFLLNLCIATVGGVVIGTAVAMFLVPVLDRISSRASAALDFEPFVLLAGFLLGWLVNRRFPRKAALWIWLVPFVFLVYDILTWSTKWLEGQTWLGNVWDVFFGNCGGTDCIYQLTVTYPLYASAAYSLAALICITLGRRPASHNKAMRPAQS